MWSLAEIAKLVNGQIKGPVDLVISGAAPINLAQAGQLTFVTNADYLKKFDNGMASAALVPRELASSNKPCIQVDHPESSFAKIISTLIRPPVQRTNRQISAAAHISPSAIIGEDVAIYPGAIIMDSVVIGRGTTIFPNVTIMENCRIGEEVTLYPGTVLYENTEIGDRVILHANVVLGANGFGYEKIDGQHRLSPQLGHVRIESDVEIGANSTVDRGTYDATTIGRGSKLDNLVMIGHNSQIGPHNLLCSQVGIAGSCQTGEYVVMGGQVGMADHLVIGNGVSVGAQSGLMHDVANHQQVFGSPARPIREQMQILASIPRLPEMRRSLRDLERQVTQLKDELQKVSTSEAWLSMPPALEDEKTAA